MKSNKIIPTCVTAGAVLVGWLFVSDPQIKQENVVGSKHVETSRSSSWDKVANEHLIEHPKCACCGGMKNRQVHHIKPFKDYPELELDPKNLITLCTDGPCNLNCHFVIGHLGNTKCHNPNVVEDAAYLLSRFSSRKCD